MTQDEFKEQITRLKVKFTERAFDPETCRVLWLEVATVPPNVFAEAVRIWLGHRKPSNPPLAPDFKQVKLNYERNVLKQNAMGATRAIEDPTQFQGLRTVLAKDYPQAKSLMDAVQIQRQRNNPKKPEGAA